MKTSDPETGTPSPEITDRETDVETVSAAITRNRYKDALRATDKALRAAEQAVSGAFDTVVDTLSDGAWEGPRAETWFHELRRQRAEASTDLDAGIHECVQALHGQPEEVEPDDWRATWSPVYRGSR
ncbi:hypothetical protein [Frankia sp. Cppng1_Ct_nod]|uniref:hypothetical protein n=1 Tax=Frankia sp. Cppng1_Ct_nod TaxID=2897162 RepID=UPI0010412C8B|nr:hypothetical protein [Frankia sp. Cppng1_Ct_nod]